MPARLRLAVLLALTAVIASGCGSGADPAGTSVVQPTESQVPTSDSGCPPPDAEGSSAIDWVPFVAVSDVHYQAIYPAVDVDESALGPVVSTVRCQISDTVGNPDYEIRNGDAAYLAAGTELREITGYRTDFRLAAYEDGAWRVYEAYHRDDAATGADLLDLEGKVTAVHLVEGDAGSGILRTVDAPEVVAALVTAMLAAPVIPEDELSDGRFDETPYFVRFDLADGTSVQRRWAVEAGVVGIDLRAPAELAAALAPVS